jgi:autotransporter translocation and assembly factor TamB
MRRLRYILLGFLALALAVLAAGWLLLHTQALWTWSGRRLVDFAQERLYPRLTIKEVRGHPFTGITFEDITLASPQGEVLNARRLELRFSLWSLVKMEPVIGRLAIYEPRVHVWRNPDGRLNLSRVLRERPPPPFRSIDLPDILVEGGEVTFREVDQVTQYPPFDFRCALLVLHPKRPEQSVFVRRAMLTAATAQGTFSLRTRMAYHRQELNILTMEVYDAAGLIALVGGTARFVDEPEGFLSGEFKTFSGETLRGFLPWWPEAWSIGGKFHLEADRTDVKLTSAGQLNGASFLLNGRLLHAADRRYHLEVGLANLTPDLAAPLNASLAEKLQGLSPLSARLQATGAGFVWPPALFEWRLTTSPFRHRQTDVRRLEATFSGEGGEQTLKSLISGNFGQLTLEAKGPLLSRPQGRIKAAAEGLKPRLLGMEVPDETLLNGAFTGTFALSDDLAPDGLKIAGELKGSGQTGLGVPLAWEGDVAWEKSNLQISRASFKAGDLTGGLKGSLKGEELDFQGQGKLPPDGALPWPIPLRGQLAVSFTAQGSWRAPDLSLEAEGRNLSWRKYQVRSVGLTASAQGGWLPRAGRLEIKAANFQAGSWVVPRAAVNCQGGEHRWRFRLQAPSAGGAGAELAGHADLSRRPLWLTVEHVLFRAGNVTVRNAHRIRTNFLPGYQLEPAIFLVNDGSVTLAGRLQDANISARLDVQDVPAEILPLPGFRLHGLLRGQATLTGSPQNPVIQGKLRSGPGQVSGFSFNTLEAQVNYRDALLSFSGALAEKTGGPGLRWEGRFPLRGSLQPFRWTWGDADMHFLVQGENTHLGMLTAFTEELQEAEGSLDLLAEWRGPVSRPQLTGHIRWGPGFIWLRQAGLPYRLTPGAMKLQGDTLTLPELILESQGTARLSGVATLEGFSPKRLEAQAALHDFKALGRAGSETFASGRLTLSGSWQRPLLQGDLVLTQGSFRTTFFQRGDHGDIILVKADKARQPLQEAETRTPAFYRNLRLEVRLASPEGVWVKNKRLKVKLAGSLMVNKAPTDDKLFGNGLLQVKEGSVEVQGREFKVTQGEVQLPGIPGGEVTVLMRGVSRVSDINLILDMRGPVRHPEADLSSEPPLPPADVLAYLVFSRPAQALTQQQFRSMGEQVVGILGGLTAKKLKDFLGKDFPLVGDVYVQGGEETMGVAKPLTKDLTVSYGRKTEPLSRDDTNQVRMDYRLNRHLKIESQLGRRNSGADVLLNLDF